MNPPIISRKEAKAKGFSRYFTGKPCPHGHVAERFVFNCVCVPCSKATIKRWAESHPANMKKATLDYYYRNQKARRQANREHDRQNIDRAQFRHAMKRAKNPALYRDTLYHWRNENRGALRAIDARHRAARTQACPTWLTKDQHREIVAFYDACPPGMSVDHIVPLQGRTVCGLHVPWNLQYLTIRENSAKGNR